MTEDHIERTAALTASARVDAEWAEIQQLKSGLRRRVAITREQRRAAFEQAERTLIGLRLSGQV